MKKTWTKIACLLLTICMMFSFVSCGQHGVTVDKGNGSPYWENVPGASNGENENNGWNGEEKPGIDITIIGGDIDDKELEVENEIVTGEITDIRSLVISAVEKDLVEAGFDCGTGVASTLENDNYTALGIYYSDSELEFFNNPGLASVGFVEIVDNEQEFYAMDAEESMIVVRDVTIDDETITKICAYTYENINAYHFVYQNQYVTYYQQTPMRIVYTVSDNIKENYDLTYGSLYDYDNGEYIYDASIFGEYNTHSGESLFGQEDYAKLEKDLQDLAAAQLAAGYRVEEYNIVYISPESIQQYLLSDETETFFGYSVEDLTREFGLGTALSFTENGFEKAAVLDPLEGDYNWKSFLTKVGIGCGIVLVGAILTPVTGGASFGCALLTITKVTVGFALTSGLGTLAIETAAGLIQGKTIEEALDSASRKGLDSFANGFMIGAAIGSVGVVSGLIKPTACFVEGTPVAVYGANGSMQYMPIETVQIGTQVYSYNEETGVVSVNSVTDIFSKQVFETVTVKVDGETIVTTPEHPFYLPEYSCWISAASLQAGDEILSITGERTCVDSVTVSTSEAPVTVYNFTVENDHTYFVGENSVLVHNTCTTLNGQRNKAVKDAWKNEVKAVKAGTSKYNWSPKQIKELLSKGSIKGYEGHHIIPVNEVVNTAKASLISDPNNIVFLSKSAHKWVHIVGDTAEATIPRVVKLAPWVAKQLTILV